MNILIADWFGIYRFGLRALFLDRWPDAQVQEAASFEQMLTFIQQTHFELLVLNMEMFNNVHPDNLSTQKNRHAKIVVLMETQQAGPLARALIKVGADAVINRASTKERIMDLVTDLVA